MDVQNISNMESPLYNALLEKTTRDPWTYSLLSSVNSFSKQRVEVSPNSNSGSAQSLATHAELGSAVKTVPTREYHWKIPRYGLLEKVIIQTQLDFTQFTSTNPPTDAISEIGVYDFDKAIGLGFWDELALKSHNNRIQTLWPEYQYTRMKSEQSEKRKSLENAVMDDQSQWRKGVIASDTSDLGSGDGTAATRTTAQWSQMVYTPCYFSFSERSNSFIDTRFVEQLEVFGRTEHMNKIMAIQGQAAGDHIKIDIASGFPKLICYYYVPTEEVYAKYERSNFSIERPLTVLGYNTFKEAPAYGQSGTTLSGTTVNGHYMYRQVKIEKAIECNDFCFATHFMVRLKLGDARVDSTGSGASVDRYFMLHKARNGDTDAGAGALAAHGTTYGKFNFRPIDRVVVKATSRTLLDVSPFELQNLDNQRYGRQSGAGSGAGNTGGRGYIRNTELGDNVYTIHWGLDANRISCSGGVSWKNLAAPSIEVTFEGLLGQKTGTAFLDTNKYELLVFHEHWQLNSFSGTDGRVAVGLTV